MATAFLEVGGHLAGVVLLGSGESRDTAYAVRR